MRYLIREGEQNPVGPHIAIIDTDSPVMFNGKHWKSVTSELQYKTVCECCEMADAELICAALNKETGQI